MLRGKPQDVASYLEKTAGESAGARGSSLSGFLIIVGSVAQLLLGLWFVVG